MIRDDFLTLGAFSFAVFFFCDCLTFLLDINLFSRVCCARWQRGKGVKKKKKKKQGDMQTGQTSIQCQHVRGEFATASRGGWCLCKLHIDWLVKSLYKHRLGETEREERNCKD